MQGFSNNFLGEEKRRKILSSQYDPHYDKNSVKFFHIKNTQNSFSKPFFKKLKLFLFKKHSVFIDFRKSASIFGTKLFPN